MLGEPRMDSDIQKFLRSLTQIGNQDDSLYDTLTKDTILQTIIDQPPSNDFIQSDSFDLVNKNALKSLRDTLFDLLVAFEKSSETVSLELSIRNYFENLPEDSEQRLQIDEVFGDYFYEKTDGKKELHPLIRRIFYFGKCYLVFMLTPALVTGVLVYFIYPQAYTGWFMLAVMICCFLAMLAGIYLHDFLNKKIQQYEGVIE